MSLLEQVRKLDILLEEYKVVYELSQLGEEEW